MAEHIVLFAGPMGAGKSSAIQSLSDGNAVATEAHNTDRETADKDFTTVAMDYGEMSLGEHDTVKLYGIPGQRRFDFMWSMLKERAMGLILLLHADGPDPEAQLAEFLAEFGELHTKGGVVVGVTRTDVAPGPELSAYAEVIEHVLPDSLIPVFTVDARSEAHMRTCLLSLITNIEMRAAAGVIEASDEDVTETDIAAGEADNHGHAETEGHSA